MFFSPQALVSSAYRSERADDCKFVISGLPPARSQSTVNILWVTPAIYLLRMKCSGERCVCGEVNVCVCDKNHKPFAVSIDFTNFASIVLSGRSLWSTVNAIRSSCFRPEVFIQSTNKSHRAMLSGPPETATAIFDIGGTLLDVLAMHTQARNLDTLQGSHWALTLH